MSTKGIILAGGTGSRLYPLTEVVSKQLMPVYSSPMIYYPLVTLMNAGIQDICIVVSPTYENQFIGMLGSGVNYGINLTYRVQNYPNGLADAYIVAEDFVNISDSWLFLGDNLFHGGDLQYKMQKLRFCDEPWVKSYCAGIFAYEVVDPRQYGVVEVERNFNFSAAEIVTGIVEKPEQPKSNYAVPGLYNFDRTASERAKSLKPSKRNELEITDLLMTYVKEEELVAEKLEGVAWLDTGTHKTLHEAATYVQVIEERQGVKVACPEEVAIKNCWLSKEEVRERIDNIGKSSYTEYLKKITK